MIIISADDARAAAGGASALPHAARERGAARTGEEIKKLVRASADVVKTGGAGIFHLVLEHFGDALAVKMKNARSLTFRENG